MRRVSNKYKWYKRRPWLFKGGDNIESYFIVLERMDTGGASGLLFLWNKNKEKWVLGYHRSFIKAEDLISWGPINKPGWATEVNKYLRQ